MALGLQAWANSIEEARIEVALDKDGSARITETWTLDYSEGTEFYLVKENLGDIAISDLAVTDEAGRTFTNIGRWDTSASFGSKAGKCGIVTKRNGCELCWGLGSYGPHTFTATYKVSNLVKTLNDYDMLHYQFVSPGLSSPPAHVIVSIACPGFFFEEGNTKFWGFGYEGTTVLLGGKIIYESSAHFRYESSVIALARFDKGIFDSPSVQDRSFDEVLQGAMEGASFADDEEYEEPTFWEKVAAFFGTMMGVILPVGLVGFAATAPRRLRKKLLGTPRAANVPWSRDIPCGGDIVESHYLLGKMGLSKKNTVASALILRMIQNGALQVRTDAKGKIEMSFNDSAMAYADETAKELYSMMKDASGSDVILQDKEFSRWSKRHTSRVSQWVTSLEKKGNAKAVANGLKTGGKYTEKGCVESKKLVGFKNFLSDTTLSKERASAEVVLWQDYLTFAALFGIADRIADELKDIRPIDLQQNQANMTYYDNYTMRNLINMTNSMANNITNAHTAYQAAQSGSSRSGGGGFSSFGGGGGFSGGGFGGGVR